MKIDLYTQTGEKKGDLEVSDKMFNVAVNAEVVRLAVLLQQANERQAIAHVKNRGEINRSTRKLYRQKGTGRARMGGAGNPIRRGGGAVFGPRNVRNFTKRMPKRERRLALFSILTQKAADHSLFALEQYDVKAPKTKELHTLLQKLPVGKSVLLVLDKKHPTIEKSAANLPYVKTILVTTLNSVDLLKYEKTLFMQEALKKAEEIFLTSN
ncbi:50S ribosomal protein L4 [Candidatus Peregrinibacteria bacterium]|nr:50S ribosomal protein L4 [Candidatus Peregrinibacteria bacterium]